MLESKKEEERGMSEEEHRRRLKGRLCGMLWKGRMVSFRIIKNDHVRI